MNAPISFTDADLCAYADDQIRGDLLETMEAWLAHHPAAREKVEEWRKQANLIRTLYRSGTQPRLIVIEGSPDRPPEVADESWMRELRVKNRKRIRKAFLKQAGIVSLTAAAVSGVTATAMFVIAAYMPASQGSPGSFLGLEASRRAEANLHTASIGPAREGDPSRIDVLRPTQSLTSGPSYFGTRASTQSELFRYAAEAHASLATAIVPRMDLASSDFSRLSDFLMRTIGPELKLPACPNGLRPIGVHIVPGQRGLAGYIALDSDDGRVGIYIARSGLMSPAAPVMFEDAGLGMVSFVTADVAVTIVARKGSQHIVSWAEKMRTALAS